MEPSHLAGCGIPAMSVDLTPILAPIIVSVLLSVSGAFVVARYAGPAQSAYVASLEGRLRVVSSERDDAEQDLPALRIRVVELEREVAALKREKGERDAEIVDLYRKLNARAPRP